MYGYSCCGGEKVSYRPKFMSEKITDTILENLDTLFARKYGSAKINVAEGKLLGISFDLKVPDEQIKLANEK